MILLGRTLRSRITGQKASTFSRALDTLKFSSGFGALHVSVSPVQRGEPTWSCPYRKGDVRGLVTWPAVCGATCPWGSLSLSTRPSLPHSVFPEAHWEALSWEGLLYILNAVAGVFWPSVGNSEVFILFLFKLLLLSCLLCHAFVLLK